MHCRRVDFARRDEVLDLRDGNTAGHRTQRVEIHRRLVEHQIAIGVAEQGVNEREVGGDRLFQDVPFVAEHAGLLWR